MEGVYHTVNSKHTLLVAQSALTQAYQDHHYVQMKLIAGKTRTLDQNKLIYRLYALVAKRYDSETPQTIRHFCKLTMGVPILRGEDEAYREAWDRNVRRTLTYEQKLAIMAFFPVTSRMNTEQESRYIDAILLHYGLDEKDVKTH